MIVNYNELDPKIEKILDILFKNKFSYEIFSNTKFNIIDNNVSFAEKRNIGVITKYSNGIIKIRFYGYKNRIKLKQIMRINEITIGKNETLTLISVKVRALISKYKNAIKKMKLL